MGNIETDCKKEGVRERRGQINNKQIDPFVYVYKYHFRKRVQNGEGNWRDGTRSVERARSKLNSRGYIHVIIRIRIHNIKYDSMYTIRRAALPIKARLSG